MKKNLLSFVLGALLIILIGAQGNLTQAMDYQRNISREMIHYGTTSLSREKLIEPLAKKELWIEVEEKLFRTVKNEQGQLIDYEFTLEVKITENKIKAVWK